MCWWCRSFLLSAIGRSETFAASLHGVLDAAAGRRGREGRGEGLVLQVGAVLGDRAAGAEDEEAADAETARKIREWAKTTHK